MLLLALLVLLVACRCCPVICACHYSLTCPAHSFHVPSHASIVPHNMHTVQLRRIEWLLAQGLRSEAVDAAIKSVRV